MMFLIQLYTNHAQDCMDAKEILEKSGLAYREIDVEKLNLQAYIWRDLGTTKLPVLATTKKLYTGIEQITEYAKKNNGRTPKKEECVLI